MPQQKKQNDTITNKQLLERLYRLEIVQQFSVPVIVAYIGLHLVNKGRVIPLTKALKIIKHSKLDKKILAGSAIPCTNILEAMIHLVILKRSLFKELFNNYNPDIWEDETLAPLLDICSIIDKEYRI